MLRLLLSIYLCLIFFSAHANSIIVQNLNDSGPGSLRQAAIDALSTDTIRFNPSLLSGANDTIHLESEIAITSKSLVIKGLYTTTDTLFLSGENTNRIFNAAVGQSNTLTLDSLAFVNGSAVEGGAVYFFNGLALYVNNCFFKNNLAQNGGVGGGAICSEAPNSVSSGWGMTTPPPCETIITKSVFLNNNATSNLGGAVSYYSNDNTRQLQLIGCTLINNSANLGGALSCRSSNESLSLKLDSCIISNNNGLQGGVAYMFTFEGGTSLRISHSEISNNTSTSSGGVGYIRADRSAIVNIDTSNIILNSSENSGGVFYQSCGSDYSVFFNSNQSTFAQNAALGNGGVLFLSSPNRGGTITANRSTFSENSAASGGAMYFSSGNFGGGISNINLTNSTVANNFSTNNEIAGIYLRANPAYSAYLNTSSSIISNTTNTSDTSNIYISRGQITSNGYNILSDSINGIQTTDIISDSAALNLLPIANNGGTTLTNLPGPFSIAINNGEPSDNSRAQNDTLTGIRDVGAAENRNVYWVDTLTNCDSLTWIDGITYNEDTVGAIVEYTGILDSGFDSVVKLDLDLQFPSYSNLAPEECYEYLSPSGNYTWNSTGVYTDTLINAEGCDSIITVDLTINKTEATFITSVCEEFISPSGNYTWNSSGTFNDTIPNVNGCDSIMTFNLTINQPNTGIETVSACETFTWIDGNTYTSSNNTATFTLTNQNGCDSLVTLDLTINQPNTGIDTQTACDQFTWIDGNTYTTDNNTATFTLTNQNGCDSIVTLDLSINSVNTDATNNSPILSADESNASYQWLDCEDNFSPISGANNQIFEAVDNGIYAVEVTIDGCSDTSSCLVVNNIGLSDEIVSSILVYPNPTNGIVNVQGDISFSIDVYDVMGRKVRTSHLAKEHEIDLSKTGNGVYLIRMIGENWSTTKRIIVGD